MSPLFNKSASADETLNSLPFKTNSAQCVNKLSVVILPLADRIQTPDVMIISQMFYHCATTCRYLYLDIQDNFELFCMSILFLPTVPHLVSYSVRLNLKR